ncbi:MAG: hypothetical protein M1401_01430 [Chloroflexi bacterium]|nr:hypothetical protein [Chloroflexota bacterium]
MRLNPYVFGIAVLVIFLGSVFTAQAAGYWSISGRVTTAGEKVAATGANPDEIKGWMTVGEVVNAYKLDQKEFLAAFELPADTPDSTAIKDLESETFSVTKLRDWLKQRLTQ